MEQVRSGVIIIIALIIGTVVGVSMGSYAVLQYVNYTTPAQAYNSECLDYIGLGCQLIKE